ncbi:hypothetical protein [Deinococcus ficus]|uniref:Uncharacterized protein n=1 Tax=Deinococcus ficus TaxID=317577 RepID=A0A221T3G8_9DEIO|nr:hypothetical protein [Deinococcus ficus]ASN83406.1 hypothetical protein DFI_19605 [Deinococcus ficus]
MKTAPIIAVLLFLTGLGAWAWQATTTRAALQQQLTSLRAPAVRCSATLWARPRCEAALSPDERRAVVRELTNRGASRVERTLTGANGDVQPQYTCYVQAAEVCFYDLVSADRASTLVVATQAR